MTGGRGDDDVELGVPLIPVASQGGPYDDDAYMAGWEMGALAVELEYTRPPLLQRKVRRDNVRQADLLGMRYGYRVEVGEGVAGWVPLRLTSPEAAS